MARILIAVISAIIFILCLSSCKHYATIKIFEPTNGHVFSAGDNIEIKADLWDPDVLFSEIAIVTSGIDNRDTALNFKDNVYTGDASVYHLTRHFTCKPQAQYKILIIASGGSSIAKDSINVISN